MYHHHQTVKTVMKALLSVLTHMAFFLASSKNFSENGSNSTVINASVADNQLIQLHLEGFLDIELNPPIHSNEHLSPITNASGYAVLLKDINELRKKLTALDFETLTKLKSLESSICNNSNTISKIESEFELSSYVFDYLLAEKRCHFYSIKMDWLLDTKKDERLSNPTVLKFFRLTLNYVDELYSSGLINNNRKQELTDSHQLLEKILSFLTADILSDDEYQLVDEILRVSKQGDLMNNRNMIDEGGSKAVLLRVLLQEIEPLESKLYSGIYNSELLRDTYSLRNELREKYVKLIQSFEIENNNIEDTSTETIINFFQGNSHTYQYITNPSGERTIIKHTRKDLDSLILKIVENMDNALYDFNGERKKLNEINVLSSLLYKKLIDPIKTVLSTKIQVIPDGALCFIPFGMLIDSHQKYLFEKYQINYQFNEVAFTGLVATDLLNVIGEFQNEMRIPGVEEVENPISFNRFKKTTNKKSILNLGSHQVINKDEPHILLSQLDSVHLSDWYEVPEVLSVLFSICAGFRGLPVSGNNTQSFGTRAYECGADNVISSLWSVDDYATSILMKKYLANLSDGDRSSNSLREASISYYNDADEFHKHPVFWASFVHYGNYYKMIEKGPSAIWFLLLLPVLFFLLNHRLRISF